ncbi:MAG: HNH endonuclease [Gammaproteobacteria bacterium]|nr:HNH endonuclease [Gammaproteobacteria bacterium]
MPRIFIAATEQARDRADLDRSVARAIDRQRVIQSFSDSTYPELIEIERQGRGFYAWGLPTQDDQVEHWFRMSKGDLVLVAYMGAYRHYAKVLGRYENARAARAIWGEDTDAGLLRQYLFFLSEPIALGQPYAALADYLPESFNDFGCINDDVIRRLEADFGSVERFIRRRLLNSAVGGPILDISGMIQLSERELARLHTFDPDSGKAGRNQIIENITRRRGHPAFRQQLLAAYDYKCAITSFNAVDALEAVYIVPFRGKFTQHASNGLLLRADLHTLFDMGKVVIDTRNMTVILADALADTSYRILAGRPLRLPLDQELRPSTEALDLHRQLSGL